MDNNQAQKGLTRTQKTGFVLLLFFGVLALGLGVLQMRNAIYNPFAINLSQADYDTSQFLQSEEARLQNIDTDRDGLNDWEEMFFYGTSPYLPDTDSDGLDDKTEIEQGTDPLCPEGEVCAALEEPVDEGEASMLSPLQEQSPDLLQVIGAGAVGADEQTVNDLFAMFSDPQTLRQILLNTGEISAEELSQIDDQTLMAAVQELLSGGGGAFPTSTDL